MSTPTPVPTAAPAPTSTHPSTNIARPPSPILDRFLPAPLSHHVLAFLSEFVGTTFYLFFAMAGAQIAFSPPSTSPTDIGASDASGPLALLPGLENELTRALTAPSAVIASLYVSLATGFSLSVSAWVFWRVTGALFNPAVAVGMCVQGSLGWARGAVVVFAEVLGGMAAAGLVRGVLLGNRGDGGSTREMGGGMEALLRGGMGVARGFFLEFVLTTAFVFAVFMLAAEKHRGTFITPLPLGLVALTAHLVATPFTSASLNPARAFGPAVAFHHFPGYHWIYWLAPLLGGVAAAGCFKAVKWLEQEIGGVVRGEGLLGHGRGESRVGRRSGVGEREGMGMGGGGGGHVLSSVPEHEHDLEKGLQEPMLGSKPGDAHANSAGGANGAAGPGPSTSAAQPRYLSGLTAVNDASDTETSGELQSPRSSGGFERGAGRGG